jgi:hypothetical protein
MLSLHPSFPSGENGKIGDKAVDAFSFKNGLVPP